MSSSYANERPPYEASFTFCITSLFFQRLLQVRPGPHRSPGEHWCTAGVRFYGPDALPAVFYDIWPGQRPGRFFRCPQPWGKRNCKQQMRDGFRMRRHLPSTECDINFSAGDHDGGDVVKWSGEQDTPSSSTGTGTSVFVVLCQNISNRLNLGIRRKWRSHAIKDVIKQTTYW